MNIHVFLYEHMFLILLGLHRIAELYGNSKTLIQIVQKNSFVM